MILYMLIKDLDFLSSGDKRKLGRYGGLTVEEYVNDIDAQKKDGVTPNTFFRSLYDTLLEKFPELKPIIPEEEISEELSDLVNIPIEEMQYHVPSTEYRKNFNTLKGKGIINLLQLVKFKSDSRVQLVYINAAKKWQEFVKENSGKIISEWKAFHTPIILPTNYEKSLGLVANLRNAILEYADILLSRVGNGRYTKNRQEAETGELLAKILILAYRDGNENGEIARKLGYVPWHISNLRNSFVDSFRMGATQSKNITLNPELVELAKSLRSECLFKSLIEVEKFCGSKEVDFFPNFDLDTVSVGNDFYVVPRNEKGNYEEVSKAITGILLDTLLPEERDVLIQQISECPSLQAIDYDQTFVSNVLNCSSFVDEFEDDFIQIKDEFLTNDNQRFVRVIFDAKVKITRDQAIDLFKARYNASPSRGPASSKQYGIFCESKKIWYYGVPLKPIKEAIGEFAEQNRIFYYDQLESHLVGLGYSIPKSIRTKITDVCRVDNKDNNHFCHKDYLDDYPNYSWRNPSFYGRSNWVLNEVKKILDKQDSISIDELYSQIEKSAVDSDFEKEAKRRAKSVIQSFCGDGHPFLIVNDSLLIKNEPYFSEADFATLGLRGKYAFFPQIRSIAFNAVKRSENGKLPLTDIVKIVNDTIAEPLRRNVIIRAIEDKDKRFAPIDISLVSENGTRFVEWTGKTIKAEPTYEVVTSIEEEYVEQVKMVEEAQPRAEISYRLKVEWIELERALKRELSFCDSWMTREGYDFSQSIARFLDFLQHAENENLREKLPQSIYEYCFAKTDRYDRSTYLTNLALFFEAYLAEIYYQNKGIKLRKDGLYEWATMFDGLSEMIAYNRDSKGFNRIASDLHYKRNKIAHGNDISLSSFDTAKAITNYIALYVYAIARYFEK